MNHAFEDIEVKENALILLEDALKRKRNKCMIGTGSMTDSYIPAENRFQLVRQSAELCLKYGFGFSVLTKSDLVMRDIELFDRINKETKCVVQMTVTTADDELCKKLEPNVAITSRRFEVLKAMRDHGIPTVVWLSPILPFINDTEENISYILDMCADAGVHGIICFGMGMTLREGNREYYYECLERLFPGLKERYIKEFGHQYSVNSPCNNNLMKLFHEKCQQYGMLHNNDQIFEYLHKFEDKSQPEQLSFWNI